MQLLDLPRDPKGQLTAIRAPLVRVLNSARHSPTKAQLLRVTLEAALAELVKGAPVEELPEPIKEVTKVKPKVKRATAKVTKDI